MLTEKEQKMIEVLEKNSVKLDEISYEIRQSKQELKDFQVEVKHELSNFKLVVERDIKEVKTILESQDKYLKGILEAQDKRISDVGAVRNWFVGLLTALVGTIIAVAVKFLFFS